MSFFETVRESILESDRPQITVWHVCIACRIPKATNTHSGYVTHCFSTATVVAGTRVNKHCLTCFLLFDLNARTLLSRGSRSFTGIQCSSDRRRTMGLLDGESVQLESNSYLLQCWCASYTKTFCSWLVVIFVCWTASWKAFSIKCELYLFCCKQFSLSLSLSVN